MAGAGDSGYLQRPEGVCFYSAVDRSTGTKLLIKTIKLVPEADVEAVLVAKSEALFFAQHSSKTGSLVHPYQSGVGTLSFFKDLHPPDEVLYIIMDRYDGTLKSYIGGRLDWTRKVALVEGTLQAAIALHDLNTCHRDIKPENILIANDGKHIVLSDAGFAGLTWALLKLHAIALPEGGRTLGTPLYMAPEQFSKNFPDVDKRADVYALGLIVHEILTGEHPYGSVGNDYGACKARSIQTIEPSLRLTARLRDVVLKACALSPEDRYSTAGELLEAFREAIREPVAVPSHAVGSLRRLFTTDIPIKLACAAFLAVGSASFGWFARGLKDAPPENPDPVKKELKPSNNRVKN